jgi:hypothetical protein
VAHTSVLWNVVIGQEGRVVHDEPELLVVPDPLPAVVPLPGIVHALAAPLELPVEVVVPALAAPLEVPPAIVPVPAIVPFSRPPQPTVTARRSEARNAVVRIESL